jgi:hypothetical protein
MQLLAERGTESAGFKSTGFERFERVWTGQQVGGYNHSSTECHKHI